MATSEGMMSFDLGRKFVRPGRAILIPRKTWVAVDYRDRRGSCKHRPAFLGLASSTTQDRHWAVENVAVLNTHSRSSITSSGTHRILRSRPGGRQPKMRCGRGGQWVASDLSAGDPAIKRGFFSDQSV